MAVEILILSGARQGEKIVLEDREFRAGTAQGCEIRFDPQRDASASGRIASFQRQEDGWYVHANGGTILVNREPVVGWKHIRFGDIVRMSASGPDFSFGHSTGIPAPPSSPTANTPDILEELSLDIEEMPGMLINAIPPTVQKNAWHYDRRWIIGISGGLAVLFFTLIIGRLFFVAPTVVVNVHQPATPMSPSTDNAPPKIAESASPIPKPPPTNETAKPVTPSASTAEKRDILAELSEQLKDSVFLIEVQKGSSFWPFATCIAVDPHTLLTTAREAAQLAAWRDQMEMKLWIAQPRADRRIEIRDIRIHGVFASLAEKAGDWIYHNSALLTVNDELPQTVSLASTEDFAKLEAGMPVFCCGYEHEGEKITRFDDFEPRVVRGKLYVITAADYLPGKPRLIHIKAEISKNAYGSAIVNADGKMIGIYGEAAVLPANGNGSTAAPEIKNMHYVTIVEPGLIDLWHQDRGEGIWLSPAALLTNTPASTPLQP